MGYEIDTSDSDTVVGTHTGLNPPRKSYRGSYKNVDKNNLNYMTRGGNSIYTNPSFQKIPTVAETRPFKHDIDYSSPTSNPGYADKMYSNGLGELGGSDEFDFSDVTTVFGDDFDVEFDNSILNQPESFDINNSRSYGLIPFSKLGILGATSSSKKIDILKRNLSLAKKKGDRKSYAKFAAELKKVLAEKKSPKKKKRISTEDATKLLTPAMEAYYKARAARSKAGAESYKAYSDAVQKTKDVALAREERLKSQSSGGKWWQIFPTGGGSGTFGGLLGGLGKAANALFLIATIGGGIWVGSKFVKLLTGSIKETSNALASLRTVPPPRTTTW